MQQCLRLQCIDGASNNFSLFLDRIFGNDSKTTENLIISFLFHSSQNYKKKTSDGDILRKNALTNYHRSRKHFSGAYEVTIFWRLQISALPWVACFSPPLGNNPARQNIALGTTKLLIGILGSNASINWFPLPELHKIKALGGKEVKGFLGLFLFTCRMQKKKKNLEGNLWASAVRISCWAYS